MQKKIPPYLTENGILNNFDFNGGLTKSDIFWVKAVSNSRISGWPEETVQILEFSTHNSEYIGLTGSTKKVKIT